MTRSAGMALCLLWMPIFLSAQPPAGRVLTVGVESDIDAPDPWNDSLLVYAKVFWHVCQPLSAFEEVRAELGPHLAVSWQSTDENRVWTVRLRDGVRFHDGSTMSADDVAASVGVFPHFEAEVEKVDRMTVRFKLAEPNVGFPNRLSSIANCVAPAAVVRHYQALKRQGRLEEFVPIGTGPFKYFRRKKGESIELEAFRGYWGGAPTIDKLVLRPIPDNAARLRALETGEIDVVSVVYPSELPRLQNNAKLSIMNRYGMNLLFLAINSDREPLGDIRVRRAVVQSIDKMALVTAFYRGGYGLAATRLLSPAFWGTMGQPSVERPQPEEAKRMISQLTRGTFLDLVTMPMARPYLPDPKGVAGEIKRQLANTGLKVRVVIPADFAEFHARTEKGNYDFLLSGMIGTTGDPEHALESLLGRRDSTVSRWNGEAFWEKLDAARRVPLSDVTRRLRLLNEAQDIAREEVPMIPLCHTRIYVVHSRRVRGIILYPSSMVSYHKATLVD